MLLVLGICGLAAVAARQVSEEEYHRMPRLFHLDDYDRCLSRPGGLYCTGSFRLSADKPSPVFELMKEYSADPLHFNRTLLHRGFCVSKRCPTTHVNASWRFERCVQQHATAYGLSAELQAHSCDSATPQLGAWDEAQRTYVAVVAVILALNFLGTLYDVATGGNGKSQLLMAWSVRANWRRLTTTYEDRDPQLAALSPLQGFRVLLLLLVMMIHATEINHQLYMYNPQFLEQALFHPLAMLMRNGSSVVQAFIVLSNFLFAYSLLLISKNRRVGLAQLPICVLHRIFRLAPVHMFVVGFAATWWARLGSGPQWVGTVGAEAATCSRKLPLHALFLHNLQDADSHCLLQTWFLAVDFQLYLVASVVMLVLLQTRWRPMPVLAALFLVSCVVNAALAYHNNWKSLLYIMIPEHVRSTFRGEESFSRFYVTPWGSLPACFVGLLTAHLHFHLQEQGLKVTAHKTFVVLYHLSVPLHFALIMLGSFLHEYKSLAVTSAYVGVERPLFAVLAAICLLGTVNNIDNVVRRVMSWRGWQVMGRMSLSVLMLHWCVNLSMAGSRRTPSELSVTAIAGDVLSTWWWTYWLAVPVTLLLELPFTRIFATLIS